MEKVYIEERAVELAHYIIDTKDTVRGAAKKFGVSKSTVHMEVTIRNGVNVGVAPQGDPIVQSISIKTVANNNLRKPIVRLGMIIK